MKKILSILLCLSVTGGAVALFSSCRRKVTLDLSAGYRVVHEGGLNDTLLGCVKDFAERLESSLGVELGKTVSSGNAVEALEILIGETDRPESAALKNKIKGDGYAFGVRKGKLVLVGTNPLYTVMALNAFAALCADAEGSTLTVNETVSSNMESVCLTEQYRITYSAHLDETEEKGQGRLNPDENPDCLSYGVVAAKSVRTTLRTLLSGTSTALPVGNDKDTSSRKELLLGLVDRPEAAAFRRQLDANSYGISVGTDKIAVMGLNDAGLRKAVEAFGDVIAVATVKEDGKNVIRLPAGFSLVSSFNSGWELNFPRPTGEGVELLGTIDAESDNLLFSYSGGEADYLSYCAQLEASGYELLQANEAAGSLYRIYRNKRIRLHVTYAAYSYAFSQDVKECVPGIRIVSSPEGERGSDYDDKYLTEDLSYTKRTNSRLTSIYFNYHIYNDNSIAGNCYITQLEDGSFIVMDGGFTDGGAEDRIYAALADLHRQATGSAPTVASPVVIAAWYLTHGHGDHYLSFTQLCKKYGSKLRVETLVSNFPSDEMCYNFDSYNTTVRNDMSVVTGYTQGEMQYIKVHTGQRIYMRNVEMEILYTPEDFYPSTPELFNDTCTVVRFHVHTTDGNGHKLGEPTTILWLGDSQPTTTRHMRAMWGETLKSDAVQVTHHGGDYTERGFYPLVQPELVLWPCATTQMTVRIDDNSDPNSWKYHIYQLYRMDSVKYHVVADLYNTTITITKDGFAMSLEGENALYNAGEDAGIVIGGLDDRHCAVIKK